MSIVVEVASMNDLTADHQVSNDTILSEFSDDFDASVSSHGRSTEVAILNDSPFGFNYQNVDLKYASIRRAVENDKIRIKQALMSNGVTTSYIDTILEFSAIGDSKASVLSSISEVAEGMSNPSPEIMAKVISELYGVGYFSPEKISDIEAVSIYRFMAFIAGHESRTKNKNKDISFFESAEFEKTFDYAHFNLDQLADVAQFNLKTVPPIDIRFDAGRNAVYLTLLCSNTDKLDTTISFWNGMVRMLNRKITLYVSCAIGSAGVVDDVQLKYFSNAARNLDAAYYSRQDDGYASRLFDAVLIYACKTKCSDVHLTPGELNKGIIRVRQDGVIRPLKMTSADTIKSIYNALVNVSGVAQNQNTTPIPYDKLPAELADRFSVRIQASKTVRGYGIVIRVLDNKSNSSELESIGLTDIYDDLLKICRMPHGLVFVTGPTGSGKTTSLYAMLKKMDGLNNIIHTIENPVEYKCSLWHQHQLSSESDEADGMMEFIKGLLRNDIDKALVGEIRDKGATDKAMQLASTGHLVMTTLHTNSAAKSITRVSEMGVNMAAFSDVIKAILAQRLVRTLCKHCKVELDHGIDAITLNYLNSQIHEHSLPVVLTGKKMYKASPNGCMYCNNTGYIGRKVVYELMMVNDTVAADIMAGLSGIEIAKRHMPFKSRMLYRGLNLIFDGHTSLEEVLSVVDE